MNLDQIKAEAVAKAGGKQLQPSYLRSVAVLNATGLHDFKIVAGQNPSAATYNIERLLNQNNAFVVTHYGFFLAYAASAAALATAARYTYPNPAALIPGDTSPTVAEVAAGEAIYNGSLGLSIDTNQVMPSLDMARFRRGPVSQQYVGNGATAGALLLNYNPTDSQENLDGYCPASPFFFVLDGGRTINWKITSVAQTALSNVYLIWEFRGFEIIQGAGMTLPLDTIR